MAQQGIFKSFRNFTQWTILLVLLSVVVCPLVFAQLPTATILGVAKDSSGSVVPDVNVTARNIDTGQTRSATSDADGAYRLSALPVGNYEVRAEKTGFQAEVQTGLTLTVGQEAVINVTLQVGSVSQTVSVTTEAPLVDTTSGSLGGLVTEQKMADLPLNGRNYIDLTLLQTGVSESKGPSTANVSYTGTYFVSNGATVRSNNYLLDGAIMVNLWGASSASATNSTLGVDGIREYRVITNNFSAQYGMVSGSQMTIVSKSGTNSFHGDVFEYLRNSAMDARNFFDQSIAANGFRRLPEFQRNNFGGSFGGPIRKDKTFFYGVFEGVRQHLGQTIVDTVMPAACHNLVVQPGGTAFIDNQADATACGGTTTAGGVTTPNLIGAGGSGTPPPTVIAAAIQPSLALYPNPNLSGAKNNFTYPFDQPSSDNYGQLRVDQTISNKDNLFVRYTIQNTTQTQSTAFPQFASGAYSRNQFITVSESHIVSANVLNTVRTSLSRTNLIWPFDDAPGVNGPQISLVAGVDMGTITPGSGITGIGASGTDPRLEKQNIFTGSDDIFYTRGRHAFQFGTLVNHYQQEILNGNSYAGTAAFANLTAYLEGQTQSIHALTPSAALNRIYHFDTIGFYGQDDWKVLPRLTLNLGLRYEFDTTPNEMNGHYSVIKNLATDTGPVFSTKTFLNPSLHNFSPRVGFAWDVKGDGKTAVRGGFDLLYDLLDTQTGANLLQTQIATPPFSNRLQAVGVAFTLPLTFPANPSSLAYRPTQWNINQPSLLAYNLAIERQLPFSMALTVAYAGSGGRHFMQEREGNPTIPQGVPGTVSGAPACVLRPAGQAVNTASEIDGPGATACFLATDAGPTPIGSPVIPGVTGSRTNGNFGSTDYFVSGGSANYNALQVGLVKRLTQGLQIQSAYTWSKSLDNNLNITGEFTNNGTSYGEDPLHPRTDYGPSYTDVTQVWKLNGIYQFRKFGSGEGVVGKLLSGWWMSGILSLQSGRPFTPVLNSNLSQSGVGGSAGSVDRVDLVPGRSISSITHGVSTSNGVNPCPTAGQPLGTASLYFDPCAFLVPTVGFFGDTERGLLRGPGFANLDSSLVKDTRLGFLGESGMLEFRAEIFNITNHPNLFLPVKTVYTGLNPTGGVPVATQAPITTAGNISSTAGTSRQVQLALKILF
jgi:hypothetical protein